MTGRYGRAALLLAALAGGTALSAQTPMARWVPAWGSAQMVATAADAERIAAIGPVTIRQVVHLSAGGTRVRVRLSNVAGDAALRIDAAALARGAPGSATVRDGAPLTFAGARTTVIPPGAEVYSDPLPLATRAGDDLAISLFLAKPPIRHTGHPGARATNYVTAGDHVAAATLPDAQAIGGWWDLADVEVSGGKTDAAIVAIGDSITDGRGVRDNANTRWTDVLARRLGGNARTAHLALVNAGIGGNHILTDGLGPSLLARFDRDVIARPNVRYAVVFEGVNDLGGLTREAPVDPVSQRALYDSIAAAFRELAARAHAHGITLIGATITPLVGNDYYHATPPTEATRQRLNTLIRSGGIFDAVIDFDAVVRDPAHPDRLLPAYDIGDHLHPNEAGYRAMGDAVALRLFGG
ncbi:SGNH/GDSL hydrolase family protein [Sphingomonas kyungheensis]|uniref:SGNH/GDSL hydrolase family protein n=1 Tax=Sphingomonas kyungheensis TaxID=1069987 RepID=A0ABU8H3N9_9SPHN